MPLGTKTDIPAAGGRVCGCGACWALPLPEPAGAWDGLGLTVELACPFPCPPGAGSPWHAVSASLPAELKARRASRWARFLHIWVGGSWRGEAVDILSLYLSNLASGPQTRVRAHNLKIVSVLICQLVYQRSCHDFQAHRQC